MCAHLGTFTDLEEYEGKLPPSDLSIRCWPLCSGKSGSVTGNLSFEYSGGGCEVGRFQFGVEDKAVRVFALGASKDVL